MWPFTFIIPGIISYLIGSVIVTSLSVYVVSSLVDIDKTVRKSNKCPNAFKYRIEKAKARAVNVGIFDESTNKVQDLKINSKKEISSEIRNDVMNWHYL